MTQKETKAIIEKMAKCKAKIVNSIIINESKYQDWLLIDYTTGHTTALIGISDNILYKVYYTDSFMLKNLAILSEELW